jgi:hypothetical protein
MLRFTVVDLAKGFLSSERLKAAHRPVFAGVSIFGWSVEMSNASPQLDDRPLFSH